MALGAFLGGMVVADTEYGHRAMSEVMPLRDATLRLLARRGLPIDDVAAARLAACAELGTLDRWFGSSVDALTIAEVFAS